MEERCVWNRKVKRQSKRKEAEKVYLQKLEAADYRRNEIMREKQKICDLVNTGKFDIQYLDCFEDLVSKPMKYTSDDGYVTYVTNNFSACTSLMALQAIDNTIGEKRKNEELSNLNNKRKKTNPDGTTRMSKTPNTTRGDDGINIKMKLSYDATITNKENRIKEISSIEKEIKSKEATVTGWLTIEQQISVIATSDVAGNATEVFKLTAGTWKADERKILLKLCVQNSGVVSKSEQVQLQFMIKHEVTYLKALACKESMASSITLLRQRLNQLQAELANEADDRNQRTGIDDDESSADEDDMAEL